MIASRAHEDAKCKKSSMRQLTMPNLINPEKNSGALGYSFYARHPVEGPKRPRFSTHQPTRSKLTSISPVINAGQRNCHFKSLLRLCRRSTFFCNFHSAWKSLRLPMFCTVVFFALNLCKFYYFNHP